MNTRLIIEEVDEMGLFEITPEWLTLCSTLNGISPFQYPSWQIPWWRNFGNGILKAVTIKKNDLLLGIGLFFITLLSNGSKKLSFVGSGISDYLDIIAMHHYKKEVTNAIIDYLADIRSEWDFCVFAELPEQSCIGTANYPDVFDVATSICSICSYLNVQNTNNLKLVIPKKLRKNLNHAYRELRKIGELQLVCSTSANYNEFLDELFKLHKARWESKGQSGVLQGDTIRNFHKESLSGLLQTGNGRIYLLEHCGKAIGVYYVLINDEYAYAYLGGLDPSMDKFSPGSLALSLVIEDCMVKGTRVFDFLRGDEPYKALWRPCYKNNYKKIISHRRSF
jgi:CelD/BcsL family acetyltransferase involved in cellulose biosynthesis